MLQVWIEAMKCWCHSCTHWILQHALSMSFTDSTAGVSVSTTFIAPREELRIEGQNKKVAVNLAGYFETGCLCVVIVMHFESDKCDWKCCLSAFCHKAKVRKIVTLCSLILLHYVQRGHVSVSHETSTQLAGIYCSSRSAQVHADNTSFYISCAGHMFGCQLRRARPVMRWEQLNYFSLGV